MFCVSEIISEHSAVENFKVTLFPYHIHANREYKHSNYNTCVSDHLSEKLKDFFKSMSIIWCTMG